MIMYLVSTFDNNIDKCLTKVGARNRLLSYFYLRGAVSEEKLERYVKNGDVGKDEPTSK